MFIADDRLRAKASLFLIGWLGLRNETSDTHQQVLSGVNQLHTMTHINKCDTVSWHEHLLNDLFISHCTEQMMSRISGEDKSELIARRLYYQQQQVGGGSHLI